MSGGLIEQDPTIADAPVVEEVIATEEAVAEVPAPAEEAVVADAPKVCCEDKVKDTGWGSRDFFTPIRK